MIWSGHSYEHVTAAELLWHVQNCDQIGLLESKLEQKDFYVSHY